MSTNRMIRTMSPEPAERTVSEPDLLNNEGVDTGYYHPSNHPNDTIRNSFEVSTSPDPLIRKLVEDGKSALAEQKDVFKEPEATARPSK